MKPEPTTTPSFPQPASQPHEARARISALMDGDVQGAGDVEQACAGWRDDAEQRRTWHCYQLVGDVMRSDELARPAAHDAAFLSRLRERLAAEPVVLAPEARPAASVRRRSAWLMPAAAVAGFAVVAGVLVVTQVSQPGAEAGPGFAAAPVMPSRPGADDVNRTVALPAGGGDRLLRDERLDEYLRAHQFARGGAALSAPSMAVRRVELTVPANPER